MSTEPIRASPLNKFPKLNLGDFLSGYIRIDPQNAPGKAYVGIHTQSFKTNEVLLRSVHRSSAICFQFVQSGSPGYIGFVRLMSLSLLVLIMWPRRTFLDSRGMSCRLG